MGVTNGRISMRQNQKSISNRLEELEQQMTKILFAINERFQAADKRMATLEEVVGALVDLNGVEEVQKIVDSKRLEELRASAAQQKAGLDQGIADGYITAAELADEKSFVVVRYLNADGTVQEPGRQQLPMPKISPEFQGLLLGKGVGTKFDMPNASGITCELIEIYSVDEDKFKKITEERQQKEAMDVLQAATAQGAADEAQDTAGAGA